MTSTEAITLLRNVVGRTVLIHNPPYPPMGLTVDDRRQIEEALEVLEVLRQTAHNLATMQRDWIPVGPVVEKSSDAGKRPVKDNAERDAVARLKSAREVLVEQGYFEAPEVGDDLAPRLQELFDAQKQAVKTLLWTLGLGWKW